MRNVDVNSTVRWKWKDTGQPDYKSPFTKVVYPGDGYVTHLGKHEPQVRVEHAFTRPMNHGVGGRIGTNIISHHFFPYHPTYALSNRPVNVVSKHCEQTGFVSFPSILQPLSNGFGS